MTTRQTAIPPNPGGAIIPPTPADFLRWITLLGVTAAIYLWNELWRAVLPPGTPVPPPPPIPVATGDSPPGGPGPDTLSPTGDSLFAAAGGGCPAANVPDYYTHTESDTTTTGAGGSVRVVSVVRQAVYYGRRS